MKMFNVLIVDDEKSNREGLKYLIDWEEYGFTVKFTAKNGIEALDIMEKNKLHLVIADIKMPIMNGLEVIATTRKKEDHDTEFIILSGYADFEYAKRAMFLGARRYLLKPVDEDELIDALKGIKEILEEKALRKEQEKRMLLQDILKGEDVPIEKVIEATVNFYNNTYGILQYRTLEEESLEHQFEETLYIKEVIKCVEENDVIGIEEKIDQLGKYFYDKRLALEVVEMHINDLMLKLTHIHAEYSGEKDLLLRKQSLLKSAKHFVDLSELKVALKEICLSVARDVELHKKNNALGVMGEIVKYINRHYNENLNLKDLATRFYMNSSYLGQLFKKTMGIHFKSYLQKLRIEESKKLLKSSNLKIYEVASKVGYEDANYFVVKFEESEGVSPSFYRKNTQKG